MRGWRSGLILAGTAALSLAAVGVSSQSGRAALDAEASPAPGRFRVLPPDARAVRRLPVREGRLARKIVIERSEEARDYLRQGLLRAGLSGLLGLGLLGWVGYRVFGSRHGRPATWSMSRAAASSAPEGAVTMLGKPRSRG
jgi:hypothetical protein